MDERTVSIVCRQLRRETGLKDGERFVAVLRCVDKVLEVIVKRQYHRHGIVAIQHRADQSPGITLLQLVVSETFSYILHTAREPSM